MLETRVKVMKHTSFRIRTDGTKEQEALQTIEISLSRFRRALFLTFKKKQLSENLKAAFLVSVPSQKQLFL